MKVYERGENKKPVIFVALQCRKNGKTYGKGRGFTVKETTVGKLYKVLTDACKKHGPN